MLPSDSPTVRSMSSGVTTSRWSTRSPNPGKNDSSVRWTMSPRFCFSVSQSPSRSSYGVYWMKQDMTCLPGGAMSGSIVLWMARVDVRPRAVPAVLAPRRTRARGSPSTARCWRTRGRWSSRPGRAGYSGSPARAKLTFDEAPWKRYRRTRLTRSAGSSRGSTSSEERVPRVERGAHHRGVELGPVGERDPRRPAVLVITLPPQPRADLRPERAAARASTWVNPPLPLLVERPGARALRRARQVRGRAARGRSPATADRPSCRRCWSTPGTP